MSICARWTGVEAKVFREATRLKQEAFAEYIGVSHDTVKKWERRLGDIQLSSNYAARMDERLAAADSPVVQRFWSLLQTPTTVSVGEPLRPIRNSEADGYIVVSGRTLTGEVTLVAVPRRNFVLGIGAGAVGASLSRLAEVSGPSLADKALAGMYADASIDHVGHFDKLRMSLIESDNIYGSAQTLPHVLSALNLLEQLKRGGAGDAQGILRMRAMFAETAAWQYQDQRDFANAEHWAAKALHWSHQLADDYCIGLSLVRMSQLACDQGEVNEAEELAKAAQRSAPDDSLFSAAALTFRAHALALAGDSLGSGRTYDDARVIVARADSDPKWGMFLDDSYIDAYQAHTYAETGEYQRATTQFIDAMARMQPDYPRDKGVYLARTAVAHMTAGDIEQASSAGRQALEIGIGTRSARILYNVRRLSGMIDPASTDRRRRVSRRLRNMGGRELPRPYVVLSVAVSLDGYIDDTIPERLYLSNDRDFDGVDQLRADCDAILIGAETVRRDNPRLWLRSEERRQARVAAGKPANLVKVTVTRSGDIDPDARMFHHHVEAGKPLVYTTVEGVEKIGNSLSAVAEVTAIADSDFWGALLDDLGRRGVQKLIVEGGTHIHTAFLEAGQADELRYAVAPLLIGQSDAPRFVNPAAFPGGSRRRLEFIDATVLDDVVVLRYCPKRTSASPAGS